MKLYVGHKDEPELGVGTGAVEVTGVNVGVRLVELVLLGALEVSSS